MTYGLTYEDVALRQGLLKYERILEENMWTRKPVKLMQRGATIHKLGWMNRLGIQNKSGQQSRESVSSVGRRATVQKEVRTVYLLPLIPR
jgi:hypothetical protein